MNFRRVCSVRRTGLVLHTQKSMKTKLNIFSTHKHHLNLLHFMVIVGKCSSNVFLGCGGAEEDGDGGWRGGWTDVGIRRQSGSEGITVEEVDTEPVSMVTSRCRVLERGWG